jgi:hypothetical protein
MKNAEKNDKRQTERIETLVALGAEKSIWNIIKLSFKAFRLI